MDGTTDVEAPLATDHPGVTPTFPLCLRTCLELQQDDGVT